MEEANPVNSPFSEEVLEFGLQRALADGGVFDGGFVELLLRGGCAHDQPEIFFLLCTGWNINSCESPPFLDEILRFIVDEEVMGQYFVLPPKGIVVEFVIGG